MICSIFMALRAIYFMSIILGDPVALVMATGLLLPAAVDLDDVLLRPARLLGEPVVVLLDPGLYEAPGVDIYYRYRCR